MACRGKTKPPIHVPGAVTVPATHSEIELDGEWEEPDWDRTAAREVFKLNGVDARPFSEIRLLHDADHLYVTLYAADENVRSSEKFDLTIGKLAIDINPQGHLTPAVPAIRTGADLDGTLDQETDDDEEWVIELAIPLSVLDGVNEGALPVHAGRCDVPRAGGVHCGAWDGKIVLGAG
ncbi:MAG: hypothetical protein JWO36_4034 [Myxococcales bacterium]|nr:hypothetical protein [Myxococcales bacterium]